MNPRAAERYRQGRWHATADPDVGLDRDFYWRGSKSRHLWACPNCGWQNDPRHMSCRVCICLRWGVKP